MLRGVVCVHFQDVEINGSLAVLVGNEDMGNLGRERRVARKHLDKALVCIKISNGKGNHVEEQEVAELRLAQARAVALQKGCLDGRAAGHCLVRVYRGAQLLAAKVLAQHGAQARDARAAAHEDHFVDGRPPLGQARALQRALDGGKATAEHPTAELLERAPLQQHRRGARSSCNGGEIHSDALLCREG
mmetsp:Transcript_12752/g.50924  ORF Transcript_12752/g.50924 Transcript_12752/m.50924 type:complete len:189 (-) Transcript_12752:160-726(-)